CCICIFCFFFFFQAEDGIRDKLVTGVQTCALPISSSRAAAASYEPLTWTKRLQLWLAKALSTGVPTADLSGPDVETGQAFDARRSEERSVGKEGRSRGATEW